MPPTRNKRKSGLEMVTKFGLDNGTLAKVSGFLAHIKPAQLFKQAMLFNLAAKSSGEKKFRMIGKGLVEGLTGRKVIFSGYEWLSFKIPGGSYKPDWCYLLDQGQWVCVEVKASKMQHNYRDTRSRLRAAASLNPWFEFYEAMPDKQDWKMEKIEPDPDFLQTFEQLFNEQINEQGRPS